MWKFVINFACLASPTNKYIPQTHTQPAQTHLQCGVTSLPANCRQVHRYSVCVCVCVCSRALRRSLSTCACVCVSFHAICACICVVFRTLNRALFDFNFEFDSLEFRAHDINFRWIVIRAVQFAFRFLVVRSSRAAPRSVSVRRPCRDVIDWITTSSASINSPNSGRTRLRFRFRLRVCRMCVCVCLPGSVCWCVCVLCPQCTSVSTFVQLKM